MVERAMEAMGLVCERELPTLTAGIIPKSAPGIIEQQFACPKAHVATVAGNVIEPEAYVIVRKDAVFRGKASVSTAGMGTGAHPVLAVGLPDRQDPSCW